MKNRVVLVSLNKYMQMVIVIVVLQTKKKIILYIMQSNTKKYCKCGKVEDAFNFALFANHPFSQNLTHTKYKWYDRITRK